MKWIAGYLFDGWNALRYAVDEIGKSIDEAMDVFADD